MKRRKNQKQQQHIKQRRSWQRQRGLQASSSICPRASCAMTDTHPAHGCLLSSSAVDADTEQPAGQTAREQAHAVFQLRFRLPEPANHARDLQDAGAPSLGPASFLPLLILAAAECAPLLLLLLLLLFLA
eukprot:337308-Rhodomonas_salina.1